MGTANPLDSEAAKLIRIMHEHAKVCSSLKQKLQKIEAGDQPASADGNNHTQPAKSGVKCYDSK